MFKGTGEPVPDFNVLPEGQVEFQNGYAKFLLQGHGNLVPHTDENSNPRQIALRFQIQAREACEKTYPDQGGYNLELGEIIIKNNANTSVAEVLEGKGVFVQQNAWDGIAAGLAFDDNDQVDQQTYRRDGRSYGRQVNTGTEDNPVMRTVLEARDQYFDYVQYMMNMVAIPLRTPVAEGNLEYLIEPDGKYDGSSATLLQALMEGGDATTTLGDEAKDFTIRENINAVSHFEDVRLNEFLRADILDSLNVNLGKYFSTFEKIRRDYQRNEVTDNIDAEIPDNPFQDPPLIGDQSPEALEAFRYQLITPEAFRGVNKVEPPDSEVDQYNEQPILNAEPGRLSRDPELGLYQLYYHYDWDGDEVSNLVEVENAQGHFANDLSAILFDPLRIDVNDLTQAYARGYHGIAGTENQPRKSGRGEIAVNRDDEPIVTDGLRVPDFGIGYYYYPSLNQKDGGRDIDNYGTLGSVHSIESIGRLWATRYPDTYPLNLGTETLPGNVESRPNTSLTGNGPRIGQRRFGVGDLSAPGGGENDTGTSISTGFPGEEPDYAARREDRGLGYRVLDHNGHENGREIDMRYVMSQTTDGEGRESAYNLLNDSDRSNFDLSATQILVDSFIESGARVIYANDDTLVSNIEDSNPGVIITPQPGHFNHFHVRFPSDAPVANYSAEGQDSQEAVIEERTVNLTESAVENESIAFQFVLRDENDIPMPQYTLVYVREEIDENSGNADLVTVEGGGSTYAARADGDGQVIVNITPRDGLNASTVANIGVYRPSEDIDGNGNVDAQGTADPSEVVESERIGTLRLNINIIN